MASRGGRGVGLARRRAVGVVAVVAAVGALAGCLASAERSSGRVNSDARVTTSADDPDRTAENGSPFDRRGDATWAEPVTEIPFDDIRRPVVVLPEFAAQTGELIKFDAILTVRSSVPALQAAQVRCEHEGETYESTLSTRNTANDPKATSAVPVRWLLRVPADGAYRCALYGHADHRTEPNTYTLQVVEHPSTRLRLERGDIVGGQVWSIGRDIDVRNYATQNLFRHVTEAVPEANSLSLYAGIEVTNNYEGRLYEYDSKVALNLVVEQLDESGRPCGQSWTTSGRHRIPREVHHEKIELGFDAIPVRMERSCTRQFAVRGSLELVSGSPVTIHGPRYSDITVTMK